MEDSWREAWERSEREHRELQARILAIPGTERVLRKLRKAGANREKVLSLLASAAEDKTVWVVPVRRQKKALESLANQLETLANHAQRVSLDPSSYGTFWLALVGIGKWEDVKPVNERAPPTYFRSCELTPRTAAKKRGRSEIY